MNRKRKSRPAFESEGEERAFWESHDSTGHVDWSKAQRVRFPNLKPSTKPISLRLLIPSFVKTKDTGFPITNVGNDGLS